MTQPRFSCVSPVFITTFGTTKTMSTAQITDYFNFLTPGDIRLKGSRIGIETILYEYMDLGRTPEEIAQIHH